jgi:hypothetical protein
MLLLSFCIPAYERMSLSRVSVPPTTRMELLGNIIKPKSKFVSVVIHQIDLLYWRVVHTHCISNPPPFDGSSFIHSIIYECFSPLVFLGEPVVRCASIWSKPYSLFPIHYLWGYLGSHGRQRPHCKWLEIVCVQILNVNQIKNISLKNLRRICEFYDTGFGKILKWNIKISLSLQIF